MDLIIRNALDDDASAICAIYNRYVVSTTITFEQDVVPEAEMGERIRSISAAYPWLVAQSDHELVGYAYATRWRNRAAYDHTVESTIYLSEDAHGKGMGAPLYRALLEALRARSVHAVVGCIALPNVQSVRFHEKCGFVKVGHFPEVGRKFERWIDVGFWQITL
jgi:L-amino acid N-acyltransferase YncA